MTHDVSIKVFNKLKKHSKQFTDFSVYDAWELYILGELISKELWTKNIYENKELKARCIRDWYGLSIVEFK